MTEKAASLAERARKKRVDLVNNGRWREEELNYQDFKRFITTYATHATKNLATSSSSVLNTSTAGGEDGAAASSSQAANGENEAGTDPLSINGRDLLIVSGDSNKTANNLLQQYQIRILKESMRVGCSERLIAEAFGLTRPALSKWRQKLREEGKLEEIDFDETNEMNIANIFASIITSSYSQFASNQSTILASSSHHLDTSGLSSGSQDASQMEVDSSNTYVSGAKKRTHNYTSDYVNLVASKTKDKHELISADQTESFVPGLTLYDLRRQTYAKVTEDELSVPQSTLKQELTCPICLRIFRKAMVVMDCLHRFCDECVSTSLRLGRKECPTCRAKCSSRRNLRQDTQLDTLINRVYPNLEAYEEEEATRIERLAKNAPRNALLTREKRSTETRASFSTPPAKRKYQEPEQQILRISLDHPDVLVDELAVLETTLNDMAEDLESTLTRVKTLKDEVVRVKENIMAKKPPPKPTPAAAENSETTDGATSETLVTSETVDDGEAPAPAPVVTAPTVRQTDAEIVQELTKEDPSDMDIQLPTSVIQEEVQNL